MPLAEADIPPLLKDFTLNIPSSAVGWDEEVKSPNRLPYEPLPNGAFVGPYFITQEPEILPQGIHRYSVIEEKETETAIFILKESANWKTFQVEIELSKLNLTGEGLHPPLYAFKKGLGEMRYYLLLPSSGMIIGTLSVPVETPLALNYGVSLARGLATLHAQQIGFGKMDVRRISIEGDAAYFSDFSGCLLPGTPEQYAQEVRQLATLLYGLLTGSPYTPDNTLPASVQPLFNQLLGESQPMPAAVLAEELGKLVSQLRRPESIDLRVGRLTDVGMLRQLNEDSLCTMEMVWNNQSKNNPVGVYVVADGMGGHEGGEIASGLTIKAITQLASAELFTPTTQGNAPAEYDAWLKKAVEAANTAVYNRSQQTRNDMGTTVVMALMVGDEAHLAHVGDSRAYHITADRIEQITIDHSLVERLVATGQISREEARTHPQGNVIYRTIGDKAKIEVDINTVRIGSGEYLLLCSDGLSGMVSDERIHQIVTQAVQPQAACQELIAAANAAGGDDNITAVIIKPEALA
ncbi:MAG: Stp1/IreP family PP2C-type Ser/Thr phosphatase [Chloroflexi bacterium]|nr:Stp1/IreP family PP2C-type Ser/Thr phosphatase [Chloroflexota bacterium]